VIEINGKQVIFRPNISCKPLKLKDTGLELAGFDTSLTQLAGGGE
jgi:hypothetical protein